ncbi:Na+/H+ antiporter subunit E [Marinobacter caseinilyticus]|uniref:Na+/H+ antiporter subunit E n=1 Tax=Marinobacter caseinilyticus TaxID=2692195 RepID=UPI0014086BF9|nr:Na+/H+ antiporter subunit E [Marinobacter caseinilyticus]
MNARFGFPRPLLSLTLLLVWLMLNGLSAGHGVLGLIMAWGLPLFTRDLWPDSPTVKKPWRLLLYFARMMVDIIQASLTVARLVLNPSRQPKPSFVSYPLTLEHPLAITLLAGTISLTPGTVSADISDDRKLLLIHALDELDDKSLIEAIHNRYEKPLLEIFQ